MQAMEIDDKAFLSHLLDAPPLDAVQMAIKGLRHLGALDEEVL